MRDELQLKLVAEHTWADCPNLGNAAFSPDGTTLYLLKRPDELNVGAMAVWFWPEVLSLIALVLLAKTLRRVWVVARHRQDRAKMYCRGCGYDLSATATEAVCPECGKGKRVAGRGAIRRVLPVGVVALLMVGALACAYAMHWRMSTPEWLVPSGPYSRMAFEWAHRVAPTWVAELAEPAGEIVKIDAATGRLETASAVRMSQCMGEMRLSRDGTLAVVVGYRREKWIVRAMDLHTGGFVSERAVAGQPQYGGIILGFDTRDCALVSGTNDERRVASVMAWDPRTGVVSPVSEEPTGSMKISNDDTRLMPSYALSGDGSVLVSVTSTLDSRPVAVSATNTITGIRTTVGSDWKQVMASNGAFAVNADGSAVYLPKAGRPMCWSLLSGARITPERVETKYLNSPCDSADEAGMVAVANSMDSSIVVLRWGTTEQLAEAALPRKTVVRQVAFSSDGRHVAVVGFDYAGGIRPKGGEYVHRVYLFELRGGK
ncbi:MAG: hypothetical protein QM783_01000 [Phycisphaerales bacterium]